MPRSGRMSIPVHSAYQYFAGGFLLRQPPDPLRRRGFQDDRPARRDRKGPRPYSHSLLYFCDDETGARLQQALIRKAKEGVKVRVLYDDVGCNGVKKEFFQQMRDAGAEVHALLHVRFPMLTDRVNYRNHRKIVVIDGRVGFFGGMNIADRYVKGPGWGYGGTATSR